MTDTNKRIVIKLTGELDANGETGNTKVIGQSLKGALSVDANSQVTVAMGGVPRTNYRYSIGRILSNVNYPTGGYLKLIWDGANTQSTIALLNGPFDLNMQDNLGVMNNTANGANGNIIFTSVNAGNSGVYTVILEIYKDPRDYDQGQIAKPQDFNYPGVTPHRPNPTNYPSV